VLPNSLSTGTTDWQQPCGTQYASQILQYYSKILKILRFQTACLLEQQIGSSLAALSMLLNEMANILPTATNR
jgi:hypothetical protein